MTDIQSEAPRMKRKYVRKVQLHPRDPVEPIIQRAEQAPRRPEPMIEDLAQTREQSRETRPNDRPTIAGRDSAGRAQVLGRDGEVLSRTRVGHVDIFHVDKHIIPDGWSYEWKALTVTGEPQRSHQAALHANGWRAVPAMRHDGIFMTPGHDGPIEQGGQILMERPMVLTEEAKADAISAAQNQVKMKQQALGDSMPAGFTVENKNLPNRASVRTQIRPSDVGRQVYLQPDD